MRRRTSDAAPDPSPVAGETATPPAAGPRLPVAPLALLDPMASRKSTLSVNPLPEPKSGDATCAIACGAANAAAQASAIRVPCLFTKGDPCFIAFLLVCRNDFL